MMSYADPIALVLTTTFFFGAVLYAFHCVTHVLHVEIREDVERAPWVPDWIVDEGLVKVLRLLVWIVTVMLVCMMCSIVYARPLPGAVYVIAVMAQCFVLLCLLLASNGRKVLSTAVAVIPTFFMCYHMMQ